MLDMIGIEGEMGVLRRYLGFWVVLFVAFVVGCQGPQAEEAQVPEGHTVITSENMGKMAGKDWVLDSIRVDGKNYALSGDRPTVKFDSEGKVSGFGSVNRFFGAVRMDGEGLVVWSKSLGSTRMAGSAAAMEQERAFFSGLLRIERFSVEEMNLYGQSRDGRIELVFSVSTERVPFGHIRIMSRWTCIWTTEKNRPGPQMHKFPPHAPYLSICPNDLSLNGNRRDGLSCVHFFEAGRKLVSVPCSLGWNFKMGRLSGLADNRMLRFLLFCMGYLV